MLQIKTFALPGEENEANEFLKTHKPNGEIARMGELLFIAYETGETPVEYLIAELQEHLDSVRRTKFQQEVAIYVMEYEMADLKPGTNKRYDEIAMARREAQRSVNLQDAKAAFVEQRINDLKSGNGTNNTPAEQGN